MRILLFEEVICNEHLFDFISLYIVVLPSALEILRNFHVELKTGQPGMVHLFMKGGFGSQPSRLGLASGSAFREQENS